ncbi:antibiotic biosynthesis monooxygenase [Roseovarius sp. EL26]|uniref:antibiotic biosynthesis monooxygenase family protein n=1 Tax=Roseovarius sp. EL26 TaxID=2126672 RepID=UPI000EA29633|nr:antibiotic biosynthesis monooxygenase [Roseovarius sp. EL26]
MNDRFTKTPEPPYYAVIFTNQLSENDGGYETMGNKMFEMALDQPGCLGAESTRDSSGLGITVSYWKDEAALSEWKANAKHLVAQNMGIEQWYAHYELRVAKVERAYNGPTGRSVK